MYRSNFEMCVRPVPRETDKLIMLLSHHGSPMVLLLCPEYRESTLLSHPPASFKATCYIISNSDVHVDYKPVTERPIRRPDRAFIFRCVNCKGFPLTCEQYRGLTSGCDGNMGPLRPSVSLYFSECTSAALEDEIMYP